MMPTRNTVVVNFDKNNIFKFVWIWSYFPFLDHHFLADSDDSLAFFTKSESVVWYVLPFSKKDDTLA